MKYPPMRDDVLKEIMVDSKYRPYFYKNKEWYYYYDDDDDDDEEYSIKLISKAPEKARESYRVYRGYYDEKLKANVIGHVPPELAI